MIRRAKNSSHSVSKQTQIRILESKLKRLKRQCRESGNNSVLYQWYLNNKRGRGESLYKSLVNEYGEDVVNNAIDFGWEEFYDPMDWSEDELGFHIADAYDAMYPDIDNDDINYDLETKLFFDNPDRAFRAYFIGRNLLTKACQ